ncbi:hypothetical protein [Mannheimia bovis]|uniref:Uncharacterized protein n=1 Tax=Mannheimia bovis TaxID=2770636 RepID=A0A7H1C0L6_9PAST|nr:hypothetical protein [Mannheimia bovis]QNS14521.1 hypothetical protein ICJ55_07060 [Mannheimia bovis]
MKKIIILTKNDFTDPQTADQCIFKASLKNESISQIEQEFDVIVYEGKTIRNRFGNTSDKPDLNKLLD